MHTVGLRHEALLYTGTDRFVAGTISFLAEAVERGDPAFVLTDAPKIERVRTALGARAAAVDFADVREVGANPAHLLPTVQSFVDATASGRTLWGVSEPAWPGRTPAELDECHQHEALVNVALAGAGDVAVLCPYDVSSLPPRAIATALETHPVVSGPGGSRASGGYAPVDPAALLATPLPEPPDRRPAEPVDIGDLRGLREHVAQLARSAGLSPSDARDLALAADEVATNTHRHGGREAALRSWVQDGAVVCEMRDSGRIDDPLVGRIRPRLDQIGGWGLWMVNQLCDLVQVRSSSRGTVVRMHMRRDRRRREGSEVSGR